MPKLPWKAASGQAGSLLGFWKSLKSLSAKEIAEEAERPFHIAIVGNDDQARLLAARLALETTAPRDGAHGPANVWPYLSVRADAREAPAGSLILQAEPLTADEALLAQTLARIIMERPDLRLSLARHVPAFRPAAVTQVVNEASWENARIALLSALPGIIPFTDFLLPATAIGDTFLLTKNQGLMLLRVAAAYGLPVDLRARTRELLPVVGSAFGWRAVARELVGLVPGGIGVAVKATIAYAGTYTVGKAAAIYYSTGQTLSGPRLRQLYKDASKDASGRVRQWLRRNKSPRGASKQGPEVTPDAAAVDKPAPLRV